MNYVGFLPLANVTDEALKTVANYLIARQAHIVCRHEDIPIIDRLYKLLGEDYPGYINTSIDAEDSDTRVVQSCDALFIYWDGSDRRNRRATEIEQKPDNTYLLLPGGMMLHLHNSYATQSLDSKIVEEWLYRPEHVDMVLSNQNLEWNGFFTDKHFFLSALSSLPTNTDDGAIYASLLQALIASAIDKRVYVQFLQSTRFAYPADIESWLEDFEIKIDQDILKSENLISNLLYNRFTLNTEFFAAHPYDSSAMAYHQSYPADKIIARLLKDGNKSENDSPLIYQQGDMFNNTDNGILFIPVNCKGSMGAGLALDAAERYPEIEAVYKKACRDGSLDIGKPLLTSTRDDRIILLFPTKNDWKNGSKLEYIESGLAYFKNAVEQHPSLKDIPLHIPKLGCGLGGLDWNEVNPIIEKYFDTYQSKVYVYV